MAVNLNKKLANEILIGIPYDIVFIAFNSSQDLRYFLDIIKLFKFSRISQKLT